MNTLTIDFETYSLCDLMVKGAHNYASHPSTGVICLGYKFNDEPTHVWYHDEDMHPELTAYVEKADIICALNAEFDYLIWQHVFTRQTGIEPLPMLKIWDIAASARLMGLPSSLADIGRALSLPLQKDDAGKALIKTYSINKSTATTIPEDDLLKFGEYCVRDVDVAHTIFKSLPNPTLTEIEQYQDTLTINAYGVPVDTVFASEAVDYCHELRSGIDTQLTILTDGAVTKHTDRKNRAEFISPKLTDEQTKHITNARGLLSFDKPAREYLLGCDDAHPDVRKYMELLDEAGGATVAKYKRMIDGAGADDRVRGAFVFSGANTGRYASRQIQLHNLRRDAFADPDEVIDRFYDGEDLTVTDMSRLIRSTITHPDGITWGDWSSIEGRVLAWLADSQTKLDIYRTGGDPYVVNAQAMFHVEHVTDDQRQAGKISELACQFQGGWRALQGFAKIYGVDYTEHEAKQVVSDWRRANAWCVEYWHKMDTALSLAMSSPNVSYPVGKHIHLQYSNRNLYMKLPSGRIIGWTDVRDDGDGNVSAIMGSRKPRVGEAWARQSIYGGNLTQSATQAVAADVLREALTDCVDAELVVVGHVHDEIICQGNCVGELTAIMETWSEWSEGLPLACEVKHSTRYGK